MLDRALDAATSPEAMPDSRACEMSRQSFADARAELARYQNLVYLTAVCVVLFLIGGIVLVALGESTRGAGIVSFVGTVVTGLGMRFVLQRQDDARKEKRAAERLVQKNCPDPQAVIANLEAGEPVSV
jgi:hypothetical protein